MNTGIALAMKPKKATLKIFNRLFHSDETADLVIYVNGYRTHEWDYGFYLGDGLILHLKAYEIDHHLENGEYFVKEHDWAFTKVAWKQAKVVRNVITITDHLGNEVHIQVYKQLPLEL